jgi:hypothetical protein
MRNRARKRQMPVYGDAGNKTDISMIEKMIGCE